MAQVQVKTANGTYEQKVSAGEHSFVSDAPKEVGGEHSGPDPHELLLASLGSCTSITMQMYAKRKGWDLKNVIINLKEEKVEDPAGGGTMPVITRDIQVEGNLDAEQVESLKAIADKCPIHKLITGSKKIETNIKKQ